MCSIYTSLIIIYIPSLQNKTLLNTILVPINKYNSIYTPIMLISLGERLYIMSLGSKYIWKDIKLIRNNIPEILINNNNTIIFQLIIQFINL